MRYIIRSSKNGDPIALDRVELSKKEIVKTFTDAGRDYLTYSARLGSKNAEGNRIEEHVTIIEDVGDARTI